MKKLNTLLLLVIFSTNIVLAQTTKPAKNSRFWFGAKVGLGIARDGYIVGSNRPTSYTFKPSFSGGIMLGYQLKRGVALELDALYSYKGVGIQASPDNYVSLHSQNIEIPLLLSVALDKKQQFFLQVGPHILARLAVSDPYLSEEGKQKYKEAYNIDFYAPSYAYPHKGIQLPYISSGEVGFALGLLYKLKPKMSIDLRYVGMSKYVYNDRSLMLSGNYYF